ncbi:hypothetical protein [Crenothrix polyspora]|uniref:Uncharacterized protein n=1 Tax=Crenothrix polyspora TaxID=360316 RepID=A0A1R4H8Y8_9GAMM|nr:hypothetical protein [Crenothrix polyspora]SJM92679.1 conserved hypothetical protein [Crenothrix polyspora]
MARIFDGRLHVHYGQAYVGTDGQTLVDSFEGYFRGQSNGLCGAASRDSLCILTGLHTGDVGMTVDVLDATPQLDDAWEDIVEVSFIPNTSEARLVDWDGTLVCNIPLLLPSYRVCYCARNMDYGKEIDTIVEEDPADFYALIFWPAPLAPDAIIKQTSEIATYWHNWAQAL